VIWSRAGQPARMVVEYAVDQRFRNRSSQIFTPFGLRR
jgi:hypothetical protein